MPLYWVKVIETRTYECDYKVEAESTREAVEKALSGETEDELPGRMREVIDRNLKWGSGEPELCDDQEEEDDPDFDDENWAEDLTESDLEEDDV